MRRGSAQDSLITERNQTLLYDRTARFAPSDVRHAETHYCRELGALTHPGPPPVEDLLSLIGDAIVSTNEQGLIILFNRAAEEMFGFSATEVTNRPIEMLLPDRFHRFHRQQVQEYASTASVPRLMGGKREVVGRRGNGSEFPVEATLCRSFIDGKLIMTVAVRDVTERRLLEEHRRLLNAELQHRMKNLMAVISAVVSLTARASGSVIAFRDAIQDRLLAVARSNELLFTENANSADLRDLLNAELAAFADSGCANVVLRGPSLSVPARLVVTLSLIAHELATNSAKYGALGRHGRQITITWFTQDDAGKQRLFLHWQETGGIGVTTPVKMGFGTELIEQSLCKAIRGKVQVEYHADGLDWRMDLPL